MPDGEGCSSIRCVANRRGVKLARVKLPAIGLRAAFVAGAAALLAACGSAHHAATTTTTPTTTSTSSQAAGLHGLVPSPLPVKPDFTFPDSAGRLYHFDAATRGKLTYLFFGYTHCPDACPATMSYLAYALHTVPAAVRRQVQVVFVTVDPKRDTGAVIRRWLDHYNDAFVGVRGTVRQIGQLEHSVGIPTAVPVKSGETVAYQVEHSSILFVFSPDDRAHVVYAQGFKATDYAHDMPLLLKFRPS
jgi:protein SCO1/2